MIKKFSKLFLTFTLVSPIAISVVSCNEVVPTDKERSEELISKIQYLEREESKAEADRTIENFESLPRSGEFTMETAIKIGIKDYVQPDLPFDASLWYSYENSEYILNEQVKYTFQIKVMVADELSDKFVTISKYSSDQMNTYKYVQYLPREFSEIQRVATSLQYDEIMAVQTEISTAAGKNKNVIYHNLTDGSLKPITEDYLNRLGFEKNFIQNNFPHMIAGTVIKAEISAQPKTVGRPVEFTIKITAENGTSKTSVTAFNDLSGKLLTYTSDTYVVANVKEDVDTLYDALYELIGDAKFEYVAVTKLMTISTEYAPFAEAFAGLDKNWKKLITNENGSISNATTVNLSTFNFDGITPEIRMKTDEEGVPMIKFGIPEIDYKTGLVIPDKYEFGEATYEIRLRVVGSTYYKYVPFTMKFGQGASGAKYSMTIKTNSNGEWEKWDAYAQATTAANDMRYPYFAQHSMFTVWHYIKGKTSETYSSFNDKEIQPLYKALDTPTPKSNGPDGIPNTEDDIPQSVPTFIFRDDESVIALLDAMGVNSGWYKRFNEMKHLLVPVYEYFSDEFDESLYPQRLKRRITIFEGGEPTKGSVGSILTYNIFKSQYQNGEWAKYFTIPGDFKLHSADYVK